MNNIFEKYINSTQKRLKKYNSLILKSRYDKTISDELVQAYIDARYYNYDVNPDIKVFYRRIYDTIKRRSEKLIKKMPRNSELILDNLSLFQYYFYFDNVRYNVQVEEIVKSIAEKRIEKFNLKSAATDNFYDEFLKLVTEDIAEADSYLEIYDSSDFYLDIKKVNPKEKLHYKMTLNYTFEFPEIFSQEAIDEVFFKEVTSEDKLFVEYPMVASVALKDVIVGNFSKVYICEFSPRLLGKKKKLDQLLEILNNQAAQEKILFEIDYNDYIDNKTEVFRVINKGFRFCLKTNENMPKLSSDEIKMLEIFDCIITNTNDINKKQYKNSKIIEG